MTGDGWSTGGTYTSDNNTLTSPTDGAIPVWQYYTNYSDWTAPDMDDLRAGLVDAREVQRKENADQHSSVRRRGPSMSTYLPGRLSYPLRPKGRK